MKEKKTYAHIDIGPLTMLFRFKAVIIFTNWLFQGLLYADKTERLFKISLDLLTTVMIFLILTNFSIFPRIVIAFVISHTFYWIFNGQLFALAKNFGIVHNDPKRIIDYAYGIKGRASKEKSIDCVLVYGSLVREEIKDTSDLDLRIIRKPGNFNGMRACAFGMTERSRALFNRFPLDMFVIDSTSHLKKMRFDEKPRILYDPNNILLDFNKR
ncbi:hypothetical protein Mpsy_2406 [Methanolobus psychrophilus R15]|nr:hypothetical protein Mpsy_2406 [Methanolobus psychrophilus R15]